MIREGHVLQNAMNVVQISKEDQAQAFEMLSAVLWIGNITFRNAENDNHVVVDENEGRFHGTVVCLGNLHLSDGNQQKSLVSMFAYKSPANSADLSSGGMSEAEWQL